jgi:hypothetical protein
LDVNDSINGFDKGSLLIEKYHELNKGKYFGLIEFIENDNVILTKEIPFFVLDDGELNSSGIIVNIETNKNALEIPGILKIQGYFKNTGDVNTRAKFISEVYCDGQLVNVIETDVMLVSKNETKKYTIYFTPTKKGEYEITGYFCETFSARYEGSPRLFATRIRS